MGAGGGPLPALAVFPQAEADAVKEALKGTDNNAIKAASDKLAQVSQEIFGKIYANAQQAQADPGQQSGGAGSGDGNTSPTWKRRCIKIVWVIQCSLLGFSAQTLCPINHDACARTKF